MPLTIATGDIVEVRMYYAQNGSTLMNVFHYMVDEVTPGLDYEAALEYAASELAEDITLWVATWQQYATEECTLFKIEVQRIFPTRNYHYSKLLAANGLIPTSVSLPLPQNVQFSLTKVSEETGRGRTGRVEIPGGHADQVSEGKLSTDGENWVDLLGAAMSQEVDLEALAVSNMVPVILYGFAPGGSPALTTYRIQPTVRVDRRRTVGVGE